jgi:hypothetical protein
VSCGQPMRDDNLEYTWLPFELTEPNKPDMSRGVIPCRVWPLPSDPGGYIMAGRRAQTAKHLWERQGAQAIVVALCTYCTVQLRPPSGGGVPDRTEEYRVESTHNQQLGMEYAHDAATCENYWVSPSTDWQNDGPEGPGYCRRSGKDLRKRVPGRIERLGCMGSGVLTASGQRPSRENKTYAENCARTTWNLAGCRAEASHRDASRGPRHVPVGANPIIENATNFCTVESGTLVRPPRVPCYLMAVTYSVDRYLIIRKDHRRARENS